MKNVVVDTHALVWFLSRDKRLSNQARAIFHDPQVRLIIPVIVLAEIKHLIHKQRFAHTLDDVLSTISKDSRCVVYSLDLEVVRQAPVDLDIHDSLIVGTALAHPDTIDAVLTRDEAIANSGLITTIW